MFKPLFLFIGQRYTNIKKRDHFITFISLVSMIGIAIGVMVLITVLSVMNGFTKEIRERILSVTPHIMINNWGQPLSNWHEVGDRVLKRPEVTAVGPYIDGQGMLSKGRFVRGTVIKGIDPNTVEAVFPLKTALIQGNVDKLGAGEFGIILGKQLAQGLNVQVGELLTLVIPEVTVSLAGVAPRLKRLKVVGIFEVGYIYDSGYAFLNIEDAAKIFKSKGGVSGVQVKLENPFAAPLLAADIFNEEQHRYQVLDWTTLNKTYFSAVKMEKTMMFFTLILILCIAIFNLVSTLVMIVTDKRADIAVLRTLGASRRSVMAIFIGQGTMIGLMGTALGILLGVVLALNVTDLVNALQSTLNVQFLSPEVYFISFLPSELQLKDVALVASCSMILSLLSTIWPAWRAANVQPAKALRNDA